MDLPLPRCRLLRLANKTLHSICEFPQDDDARKELENLRLTCHALQHLPEERLFGNLYLDSYFDSLKNSQQLSRHHHIRHYVTDIHVDVDLIYEDLTHGQYKAKVDKYYHAAVKQDDGREDQ